MDTGVVGATGLVGRAMIQVLQERSFPVDRFRVFASRSSEGKTVCFRGTDHTIEIIAPEAFCKGMLLFGATSAELAREWVPMALDAGAVIVDNSSAYRMDPEVPLVVPEVNGDIITGSEKLVANPNCSTIQLVAAIAPLAALSPIEWVSVATYQAVSGAGAPMVEELRRQELGEAPGGDGTRYSGNVVTSIGRPGPSGYCLEELKLMRETLKILRMEFPVYASTARVPVHTGHTEAVAIRFRSVIDPCMAAETLGSAPGIRVSDSGADPLDSVGTDDVIVDRIRSHPMDPRTLLFWVIADNMRKGAALNAVQIAELIVKSAN